MRLHLVKCQCTGCELPALPGCKPFVHCQRCQSDRHRAVSRMVPKIPVWLDCDPGHDDAMAIILAGWDVRVALLGISTVAGNQTVEKCTRNALDVLHVAGLQGIEVHTGQAKPLIRPSPILCPEIHGDSGLDGPQGGPLLPRCDQKPSPIKAVIAMAQAITRAWHEQQSQAQPHRVRLTCTGALTNAAVLLILYPEVHSMIEIVLMGGCMGVGNTGPVVEFNIQTDPEAAKVVFEAGIPLVMVPLEVTHTALATKHVLERIASCPTPFGVLMQQLLLFFADTYKQVFKFDDPPLHDPCAVAYVIAPELFMVEQMRVDIETSSRLSAGQTVCDIWHQSKLPKNCTVAKSMDVDGFWDLMLAALSAADQASPFNSISQL